MKRPPRNFKPHPFTYHQEIELTIDDLGNLGQGVGRIDGWVVMVPLTLPSERVLVRIWRNKSNYSEGDLVKILIPSPHRVAPQCPIFGECGGCQYQHLDYSSQLEWKTRQIKELLRRIGGIETEVNLCHGSPLTYGYRSKLTPHYEPRLPGRMVIGFQRSDSRSTVDIPACPIASPAINAALPVERARLHALSSQLRRGGTLLLRDSDSGVCTDNNAILTESIGSHRFSFQAGEFFQNNPHILPDLVDYTLSQAAGPGIDFLVDAYCGVGVFGLCGADRFQQVIGIEVNPKAINLANGNAAAQGITNISFQAGEAEHIFANLTFPADSTTVLIDPPRKGCDDQFLTQLFAYGPARVVYVSCGPDTQARDLKAFTSAGYHITRVQPFDLFPQTRHIENVITLSKLI